ncbi:Proteasome subunit beta type-3-A [Diplonema papillatum]|nr:Proteasome subunit beta type-3-A [Diplonema papillatum]
MSIHNYNGGAVLALCGKDAVFMSSDNRLGTNFNTIARNNVKYHKVTSRVFVGLAGLETDNQTVLAKIRFRLKMFLLREEREMPLKAVVSMISNLLYQHRFGPFFVNPVVCGFDEQGKPHAFGFDFIGCSEEAPFMMSGTASSSLLGTCEAFYKEGMDSDELFEVGSQALMCSLDRDCLAGWGASVTILKADGTAITRSIKTRLD